MVKQSDKYRVPVKRLYHGHSMKGTFRQGDMLLIDAAVLSELRPGDVVVFFRQRGSVRQEIVHRVARRFFDGVMTRGDAVACEDRGVVTENNFVGRVYRKERNGRISSVHGRWLGLCRGRTLHFYWKTRRQVVRTILPLYDTLKASGIIRRLWKPEITRICLASPNGRLIQFLYKKKVIARFWPEEGRFECKKPWDLVVKVESKR